MIPSNLWPHTHHDVLRHLQAQYDQNVSAGNIQPVLYPWDTLGALVVILYMLIPQKNRPWVRKLRFFVFTFHLAHTAYTIRYVRAKGVATSTGLGLLSSWTTMYVFAVMICNDPQRDFMRIERKGGLFGGQEQRRESKGSAHNGSADDINDDKEENGSIREDKQQSGTSEHDVFAWQHYPETHFLERLDWVLDLLSHFRGATWTWRTTATPPPPKVIQEQIQRHSPTLPKHSFRTHQYQPHVYPTRRAMLIGNLKTFVYGYLILDVLKTMISHDPYFWGYVDRAPAPYLPRFILASPVLIHMLRLTICQFAIKTALEYIFALGPLFFSGLIGPSLLGARAEPWVYPAPWGSYSVVLDRGLGGWWAGWWHQTFRFAFEAPSRKLIEMTGVSPKSPAARLLQLFVAFSLSGVLHASGSKTCLGTTMPLAGPMRFFLIQALGCFVEGIVRDRFRSMSFVRRVPRWFSRTLTFIYVHVWFYQTGHLICDDFAKGGVWLFEPVPISLFRGLGLGAEGDGWLALETGSSWHNGGTWYKTGITF